MWGKRTSCNKFSVPGLPRTVPGGVDSPVDLVRDHLRSRWELPRSPFSTGFSADYRIASDRAVCLPGVFPAFCSSGTGRSPPEFVQHHWRRLPDRWRHRPYAVPTIPRQIACTQKKVPIASMDWRWGPDTIAMHTSTVHPEYCYVLTVCFYCATQNNQHSSTRATPVASRARNPLIFLQELPLSKAK